MWITSHLSSTASTTTTRGARSTTGSLPTSEPAASPRRACATASDDPDDVLIIHGFGTLTEAETFLNGAELRETMQRAGVAGPPRVGSTRTPERRRQAR